MGKYLDWLKERKKAILEIPDNNLQRNMLNLHKDYEENYKNESTK